MPPLHRGRRNSSQTPTRRIGNGEGGASVGAPSFSLPAGPHRRPRERLV